MNIGQEKYKKTIIKLKGRGATSHKSSKTFWEIAALQPKNRQKSAALTLSMEITDLEITSVLPCLN